MAVNIRGLTRIKSQALVNFPPTPSLNLDFTTPYVNGLNPLPSTVTFSRADASAIATHVGPDGLVRRAAHNITVPSAPGAGWDFVSLTSSFNTSETTAPDGSSTAAKISNDDSGTAGYHYLRSGVTSTVANNTYVWSGYLKKGTITVVQILCQGTTSQDIWANFDLNAGAIGNKGTATTAYMISVGNGWYRCSISGTSIANNNIEAVFFSGTNNNSSATRIPQYTGSASNYFYVWGAQLEQNITPSYYVPTTSAAVYSTPRFDYDPVTLQPKGLLIEEARTNLIIGSNNFNNAANGWAFAPYTSGITITSSATVGPDGISDSATLLTSTVNQSKITYSPGVNWSTNNELLAFSLWIKRKTGTGTIELATNLEEASTYVDVTSQISSTSWTRISIVKQTRISGGGTAYPMIRINTSGDEIYVYGSQVEKAAFASSYIPTTSGSVTRAIETTTMTGSNFSSWFNASEGTFYTEYLKSSSSHGGVIRAGDGTTSNRIDIFYRPTNNNLAEVITLGSTAARYDYTVTLNQVAKATIAYKENDFNASYNGTVYTTDTTGSLPTVNRLYIGTADDVAPLNGTIAKIQYWPTRFSNEKLQLITKG